MRIISILLLSVFIISCNKNIDLEKGKPVRPGRVCLLVDYDGHFDGVQYFSPGPATEAQKQIVRDSTYMYLSRYDILITENELIYSSFPSNRRWRVVVTNNDIVYIGITIGQGGMVNGQGTYSLVWYYAAMNNIGEVGPDIQLARNVSHEFLHGCGLGHEPDPTCLMYLYPYRINSTRLTQANMNYLDKIIKRR